MAARHENAVEATPPCSTAHASMRRWVGVVMAFKREAKPATWLCSKVATVTSHCMSARSASGVDAVSTSSLIRPPPGR